MAFRTFFADFFLQIAGADSQGIRFAGGINIGENDLIRQGQRVCKIRKEGFGPGIGMGLEYAPESFMGIIHSSLESCCNFCGMMRIIIYYGDAVQAAFILKAAIRARKILQGAGSGSHVKLQLICKRERRQGIQDIMFPGHSQRYGNG